MKSYKHILLATNLNSESDSVADKAKSIADKSAAKLSIVHIIEFSPMMYGGGEFAIPLDGDIESSIHEQAKKALQKLAKRLNIPGEDQYLETGDATATITKLVKNLNIDLLILGSHKHHGLGFLLGSTSNAMLHAMPCDVLAIRIK